jgi:hypothetical protein
MHMRTWLTIVVLITAATPAIAGQKVLKPELADGQFLTADAETKIPIAAQRIGDIGVHVSVVRNGELFKSGIVVYNFGTEPITVEQEKFFLLNAYEKPLYRFPDYEIKEGWYRLAHMPRPAPPPPRRYYTIEENSNGRYSVNDLGAGYYSVDGFSTRNFTVSEHYDYSGVIGFQVGSAIKQAFDRRKAGKQIEALDKWYFQNRQVSANGDLAGLLFFQAIAVSPKTPVTLVLFVKGTQFRFTFAE